MGRLWATLGTNSASFVAGINAYIDEIHKKPDLLPIEFQQLAYHPARWDKEDVVRIRSHGLTRNLNSEVARARLACHGGLEFDRWRIGLQPTWTTQIPKGLDPCLPKDVLAVFHLATQPVRFSPDPVLPSWHRQAANVDPHEQDAISLEGSNNWVVSAEKSTTGRAIMANDPHRSYTVPSLRYMVHLSAPGLDVIGAGEPVLPGISIGHNGTIAFGLTIFGLDQEDLYVYELNPDHPNEYRYQNQWEAFKIIQEQVDVRGSASVPAPLKFTRHGPVIFIDQEKNRAFALRSVWFEPGTSPYLGGIQYMRAKNFKDFQHAMAHWGAPAENQVYADVQGHIGWVAGGRAPKRPNWDGLLPVPGDGRYEWSGFWAGHELPSLYRPTQGWFASANQMNLPPFYPYSQRKLGFEWTHDARFRRIKEILSSLPKISLEDSMRLQNDIVSVPARRLVDLIKNLELSDNIHLPESQAAINLLKLWDGAESADSQAAALFEVWTTRHLGPSFKKMILPGHLQDYIGNPDIAMMLNQLEEWSIQEKETLNRLLRDSLASAYQEMIHHQGRDPQQWRWGNLHRTLIEHPLSHLWPKNAQKFNVGPFQKSGGPYTPNQSSYRNSDFRQSSGPSFRIVVDVGAWDRSKAINMPGQSGRIDSPHYQDLAQAWLQGNYHPLLYSRSKIVKATRQRLVLKPLRTKKSSSIFKRNGAFYKG
jgi:penicillin amidase